MRLFVPAIVLLLGVAVAGCASSTQKVPAVPVASRAEVQVDLPRYMGRWYVIANIPYSAEAGKVGAYTEYRLREVINHRLGFRNFPAFINHYRLDEIEQKMVDPAFDRRPLLTLALEAGFGSIGPFNRAFRERHGITPTSFRQQRGATPAAS